jgi:hypothetical protein
MTTTSSKPLDELCAPFLLNHDETELVAGGGIFGAIVGAVAGGVAGFLAGDVGLGATLGAEVGGLFVPF